MKVLIHDLSDEEFSNLFPCVEEDILVISNHRDIKRCSECFYCWTKTPGKCKLRDNFNCFGDALSVCSEIIVISKSKTGDFSPFIKNILKRSVCFLYPRFEKEESGSAKPNSEKIRLSAYFYGRTTDKTKEIISQNVRAQAFNLKVTDISIHFSRKLNDVPSEMVHAAS